MTRIPIRMPELGMKSEAIAFGAWLVEPGAPVEKAQDLFEVEADKATVVFASEHTGTLDEIMVTEGEVREGDLLAYIVVDETPEEARR